MINVSFPAKQWSLRASGSFSMALLCIFSIGCGTSQNVEAVADQSAPNKESSAQITKQLEEQSKPLAEEKSNSNDEEEAASTEVAASEPEPEEREIEKQHELAEEETSLEASGISDDEEAASEETAIPTEEETSLSAEPEPNGLSTELSLQTDGEQPFLLTEKQPQPDFTLEPQQPKTSKANEWKVVIRESWKDYLPDLGLRYINQRIDVVSKNPTQHEPMQFVLAGRADYIPEVPFEPSDPKLQTILKKLNEAGIKLANQVDHIVDGKPKPPFALSAYCSQVKHEDALELLVNFPEIKRLTMTGNPHVTSAALSPISQLSKLEELYLKRTAVGDEGIAKLSKLQSLKKLDLSQTNVTDTSFSTFVQLTNLKTLGLQSTFLSENLIQELKENLLPECAIDFSSIDIPKDYAEIEHQPFVINSRQGYYATTAIRFGGPSVRDAQLMSLRNYTGLNVVCIDGTRVNGEGLRYLKQLKMLTCVIIRNSPFTDDGLKQLAEFRNLKYLVIEGGSMSDAGIEAFKKKKPAVEFVRLD